MNPDHKASLDRRENKALGRVRTKVHVIKNWRLGEWVSGWCGVVWFGVV